MAIATVSFAFTTVAAASGDVDIWELVCVDDRPFELVGYDIGITSELGDAAEEFLQMSWVSGNTTSSNGSAATPAPVNPRESVGFTAEVLGTTIATTGTSVTRHVFALPARGGTGGPIWYPDGCGPRIDQANTAMYLRLLAAVADDLTMGGTVWVREV